MNNKPKIRELIMSIGISPEDEHYDVAETILEKVDDILLLQQLDCVGNHDSKSADLLEKTRFIMKSYFESKKVG